MYNDMKIFRSFLEATEGLPAEQFKEAWLAILHYGLDRVEDECSPITKMFLTMAKPVIDNSIAIREGNSRGGRNKKKTACEEVDAKSNEVDCKSIASQMQVDCKSNEQEKEYGIRNMDIGDMDVGSMDIGSMDFGEGVGPLEEEPPYNPPKGKRKRFVKPTVEEVSEYCTERQNDIDPEEFVDFYESKGWKVGREPMKDWKACVRTWEKSHRHRPREKPKFNTDNYLMSIAMGGTA